MGSGSRLAKVLGRLPLACSKGELLALLRSAAPVTADALLRSDDASHDAEQLRVQASGSRVAFIVDLPPQQRSFAASAVAVAEQLEEQEQQPPQPPQQEQEQDVQSSSSSSSSISAPAEPRWAAHYVRQQQTSPHRSQLQRSIMLCPSINALTRVVTSSGQLPGNLLVIALQRLRRLDIDHKKKRNRQLADMQQLLQAYGEQQQQQLAEQQQQLAGRQQQHTQEVDQLLQQLCEQLTQVSSELPPELAAQALLALGQVSSPLPAAHYPLVAQLLTQLTGHLEALQPSHLPVLAAALAALNASNLDAQHSLTQQEAAAAAAAPAAPTPAADNPNHTSSSDSTEQPTPAEPQQQQQQQEPAAAVELIRATQQQQQPAAAAAEAARQLLVELCGLIQQSPWITSIDAAGVARIITSLGRLGHYDWQTMRRLSLIAAALAQSMTASNITSVLIGCAKLHHYDQELCAVLAEAAEAQMPTATGPQVSQIAWALAHMKHDIPGVFAAAAQQAIKRAHEFEPRHVSNISWAFAVRKAYSPTLCNTLAARVQQLMQLAAKSKQLGLDIGVRQLEPHHFSIIAWSLAKQGHKLEGFMRDLGDAAADRADEMLPQNISNLAWAYGCLNTEHPKLFDALTAAARSNNLEGWGNQNMTDLAWGCAATKYQDEELFELLSRATVNVMHELSPHSLSDLTWAFAANKPPSAAAVLKAAAPAAAACLERFSMGMLADIMWAYAHVKVFDEQLMQAAAQVLPLRTLSLNEDTDAQAKVLWCLKTLDYRDPQLEAVLEEVIPSVKQLLDS